LEKKLFGIPDFFIAFGSPIDANIMDIFGFGRGPPRWAQQPLEVLRFFKIYWRCTTFGRSYLEIWLADLGENMLVGKVK
jgi:hypothetical protein